MFCRKTGIVGTGGNCLAFMRPFLFYFMTKFRGSPFLQIHKQKFELFVTYVFTIVAICKLVSELVSPV